MILKGNQRAGGNQLAAHLMNVKDNDHVTVHELRGFVSESLEGAFNEAYAISRGTKAKQYLFSLSLNPPETEFVSVEILEAAITDIESKLGLESQPRAIVFHEKEGRRHAHCVWSRIDMETMKAINLPHYKLKLLDMSRKLYIKHQWKMPRGLVNSEERDPLNFTLEECQHAKRAGVDPRKVKESIQDAWAISDTVGSFRHALLERGFRLARGELRGHVAVDVNGNIFAISRAVGAKAHEVRMKLGGLADLPEVRTVVKEFDSDDRRLTEFTRPTCCELSATEEAFAVQHRILVLHQKKKREEFSAMWEVRGKIGAKARSARLPRGLKAIWSRMTGSYRQIQAENEAAAISFSMKRERAHEQLIQRQLVQQKELKLKFSSQDEFRKEGMKELFNLRQAVEEKPSNRTSIRDSDRKRTVKLRRPKRN